MFQAAFEFLSRQEPFMRNLVLFAFCTLFVWASAAGAYAEDRHAGYYYPKPEVIEEYEARAPNLPENDRSRRLAFVSGLIRQIADEPYPPTYAIFAKGDDAEKLIIVGMRDGFYDTIYRTRALLAALTALSRATPLFQQFDPEHRYTFFDLCYMLGFQQLTLTNGREFAHQVVLVPPTVGSDADKVAHPKASQ
jgi:hypothetical protein